MDHKLTDDLLGQLEGLAYNLGTEAADHLSTIKTAYREILMLSHYKQINESSPQVRLFKIVVLPEGENKQSSLFTGTLVELKDELFKILSKVPSELFVRQMTPEQLRYSISLGISLLYKVKDSEEDAELVVLSPVKHVVTLFPGIAEATQK